MEMEKPSSEVSRNWAISGLKITGNAESAELAGGLRRGGIACKWLAGFGIEIFLVFKKICDRR